MKEISLTQGLTAIVDDFDYAFLSQYKWQAEKHAHTYYAGTSIKIKGSWIRFRMHRLILNAEKNDLIDHINRNGLDNRRSNLRLASQMENSYNRNPKYKYLGVFFDKTRNKWRAAIKFQGRYHTLGRFNTEDEAGIVVQQFRLENGLL